MKKNGETEGEYGSIDSLEKEIETMTSNKEKQKEQILILNESTKQNLVKRQTMKDNLYENYQDIRKIKDSIEQRITNEDIRDFLELVIKNNFLESQNVQLLLNLQLQARTMIDLKNMITKQQKFIDDNDIVGKHDGSKYLHIFKNIYLFFFQTLTSSRTTRMRKNWWAMIFLIKLTMRDRLTVILWRIKITT